MMWRVFKVSFFSVFFFFRFFFSISWFLVLCWSAQDKYPDLTLADQTLRLNPDFGNLQIRCIWSFIPIHPSHFILPLTLGSTMGVVWGYVLPAGMLPQYVTCCFYIQLIYTAKASFSYTSNSSGKLADFPTSTRKRASLSKIQYQFRFFCHNPYADLPDIIDNVSNATRDTESPERLQ